MKRYLWQCQLITICSIVMLSVNIAMISSCKNKTGECKGSYCYPLRISGKTINGLTREPVANIPFILEWNEHSFFSGNKDWTITKISSGADGTFNVTVNVDTTLLHKYKLYLRAEQVDKYLMWNDIQPMEDTLKPSLYTNLIFPVYPKVPLTLKINRKQSDKFSVFWVDYYFIDEQLHHAFSILSSDTLIEQEVKVFTSPDLFTKIVMTKKDSNSVNTKWVDSIKCTRDNNNVYRVSY